MTSAGRTSSTVDWWRMARATDNTFISEAAAPKPRTTTATHVRGRLICLRAVTFRIIVVDSLSDKNPLVKQIRRAVSRGALTEDGYAVAEGVHLLEEALAAKCEIGAVIVAESARVNYPDARVVSDQNFRELASNETPQGVIALVRPPVSTLAQMTRGDGALLVVLDGVQDPGNAGAILRAAEA